MYGPLILMSLPIGNFTILRFHRALCVLRLRRCLTGSLATGSTLRLRREEKEANYFARRTIVVSEERGEEKSTHLLSCLLRARNAQPWGRRDIRVVFVVTENNKIKALLWGHSFGLLITVASS